MKFLKRVGFLMVLEVSYFLPTELPVSYTSISLTLPSNAKSDEVPDLIPFKETSSDPGAYRPLPSQS